MKNLAIIIGREGSKRIKNKNFKKFHGKSIVEWSIDALEKTNLFDKAWWGSIFIFSISQLVDIQYFDGRISIFYWILLAGIKNIIDEENHIKIKT